MFDPVDVYSAIPFRRANAADLPGTEPQSLLTTAPLLEMKISTTLRKRKGKFFLHLPMAWLHCTVLGRMAHAVGLYATKAQAWCATGSALMCQVL